MNRLIILLMALIFCFSMTGCGKSASERLYERAANDADKYYERAQRDADKYYEKAQRDAKRMMDDYGY